MKKEYLFSAEERRRGLQYALNQYIEGELSEKQYLYIVKSNFKKI